MLRSFIVTNNARVVNLTNKSIMVNGVIHDPHPDHATVCTWEYQRIELQDFAAPIPFHGKFELHVNEDLIHSHIAKHSVVLVDIMLFCILYQSSRHDDTLFQHSETGMQLLAGIANLPHDEIQEANIVTTFECCY